MFNLLGVATGTVVVATLYLVYSMVGGLAAAAP
jgi:hypothetical protein